MPVTEVVARRREPKALRREQLINATIDSLAKRGYAATTLADVADGAGLSRGIVNFHFTNFQRNPLVFLLFIVFVVLVHAHSLKLLKTLKLHLSAHPQPKNQRGG